MGKEGRESMRVFFFQTGWKKRATVSDAAVMWAGKRKERKNGNER